MRTLPLLQQFYLTSHRRSKSTATKEFTFHFLCLLFFINFHRHVRKEEEEKNTLASLGGVEKMRVKSC